MTYKRRNYVKVARQRNISSLTAKNPSIEKCAIYCPAPYIEDRLDNVARDLSVSSRSVQFDSILNRFDPAVKQPVLLVRSKMTEKSRINNCSRKIYTISCVFYCVHVQLVHLVYIDDVIMNNFVNVIAD